MWPNEFFGDDVFRKIKRIDSIRYLPTAAENLVHQWRQKDKNCLWLPEDLPEAMNDREKWRETVRDIRAGGATWWWWWISQKTRKKKTVKILLIVGLIAQMCSWILLKNKNIFDISNCLLRIIIISYLKP